jgi:hypothetical protein
MVVISTGGREAAGAEKSLASRTATTERMRFLDVAASPLRSK